MELTQNEQLIHQMYIAYYQRPADPEGLTYWVDQIEQAGSWEAVSAAFGAPENEEFQGLYGDKTRAELIAELYQSAFNRAAVQDEIDFWANSEFSDTNLAFAIINGAQNDDLATVNNKVAFAAELGAYVGDNEGYLSIDGDVKALLAGIDANSDVSAAAVAELVGPVDGGAGETFTLTTSVDDVTGTDGNDTFKGIVDAQTPANATLTALDSIDGGAGIDTLSILDTSTTTKSVVPASLVLTSIETVNVRSANDTNGISVNTSGAGYSSVNDVNVTQALGATDVTASTSQDVSVSGVAGDIDVVGGEDVSVTDNTADAAITVGNGAAGGDASGSITIVDNDNAGTAGADDITVEGGTDVTVTTTSEATSGDIIVGDATNGTASGDVVVNQNTTSDASAAVAVGDVTVTGGSTITINANSTNTASAGNGANVTAGTYTANAGNSTTDISVTQNHVANDFAASTTGNVTESASVKFGVLKSGDALTISTNGDAVADAGELTFTAAKDLTAEEVAAAFANLTAGDTQAAGGSVENGVFTGSIAGWTSGSASGDTVVFTSTTADSNIANNLDTALTDAGSGNGVDATVTTTEGAAGTTVAAQNVTTANGQVVVSDNATASVTSISIDGYATGSSVVGADALQTLSLANSDAGADLEVETAATSLAVNVDGVTSVTSGPVDNAVVNLDSSDGNNNNGAPTVTDLTLNVAGSASNFILEAQALENLTIAASADLDISTNAAAAAGYANIVETVAVSGAGDVTLGDISNAATALDAAAATGDISATVDGTKAVVTTGTGDDSITVNTAGISKAINLGEGDDTLTLSAATANVPTAAVAAGAGIDTIAMTSASAQALDGNTNFATAISGFERLTLSDAAGSDNTTQETVSIDLEALGFNYVTSNGTVLDTTTAANSDILELNNMASNGTLSIIAAAAGADTEHTVNVKDASTGTADVLNLAVSSEASLNAGTVTANDVETINIAANDVFLADANGDDTNDATHTLGVSADSATSVVVTGDDLVLDTTGSALTSVDASAMTGGLEYTADGAAAGTTVTGGQGSDTLTASDSNDVLNGGAGDDTLTGDDLTQLTGGEGADTFVLNAPSNVNSYSTITDLEAGDVIDFDTTDLADKGFISSAVELAGTAVFQDYANATVAEIDGNANADVAWFQFDGNTYIIESDGANGSDFASGDSIIQIAGLVDLSTASYNQTDGTLEIA